MIATVLKMGIVLKSVFKNKLPKRPAAEPSGRPPELAHSEPIDDIKPFRYLDLKGIIGFSKTLFNYVKGFQLEDLFPSIGLNVDFRETLPYRCMLRLKKYHRANPTENKLDLISDCFFCGKN